MNNDKYTDIMIDIETLDTRPTAIILSIAALCFRLGQNPVLEPEFYQTVYAPEQELLHGRTRCPETVKWWEDQADSVINEAFSGQIILKGALCNLARFIAKHTDTKQVRVWAKSPQFDLVILRHALDHYGIPVEWCFRNERDVRTYIMSCMKAKIIENLEPHHALNDARHQIEQLWWAYRHINK